MIKLSFKEVLQEAVLYLAAAHRERHVGLTALGNIEVSLTASENVPSAHKHFHKEVEKLSVLSFLRGRVLTHLDFGLLGSWSQVCATAWQFSKGLPMPAPKPEDLRLHNLQHIQGPFLHRALGKAEKSGFSSSQI